MGLIEKGFEYAKEMYSKINVDVEYALNRLDEIPVSIQCWQGDDVKGFENLDGELTGGIAATGNYPGRAKGPKQLRADLDKMLSYIPGKNKVNIHAFYLENHGKKIDRDEIAPEHFEGWVNWAIEKKIGLDFNPTTFSHTKGDDGYTLSHRDKGIRNFWIEHCKRSRDIADYFGRKTGEKCINNIWIHDGEKEFPIDALSPRLRLVDSLNEILEEKMDNHIDSVESKLFGIGSEGFVTGSFEFYLAYVSKRNDLFMTMDTGHFHPTETVHTKLAAILPFVPGVLLHVSRAVRWDSDHVVLFDDNTRALMQEIEKTHSFDKVNVATDFFDASINRLVAWIVGVRNTKKAILESLLMPVKTLQQIECEGDYSRRLSMLEGLKTMPIGAVWDYYCEKNSMPSDINYINDIKQYEETIINNRKYAD